jgi:hypothetical protein
MPAHYRPPRASTASTVSDLPTEAFPALMVAGGPRNGETLVLDSPGRGRVLGSAADCNLRFSGSAVDNHHARVTWEEARGIVLADQSSANGTWVNGERVAGERILQDGDRISLGPPGSAESVKLLVQIPPLLEAPLVLDADEGGNMFDEPFSLDTDEDDVFDASAQGDPFPIAAPAAPPPPPPPVAAAPPPAPAAARPPAAPPPAIIFEDEDPLAAKGAAAPASAPRKPVYSDQLPSIVVDRPRESMPLPPMAGGAPRRASAGPSKALPAILGTVALLVLAGGGFFALRFMRRPAPVLTSLMPAKAEAGQSVTVNGTGFAERAADNVVRFGDEKGTVTTVTETQLTVIVPEKVAHLTEVSLTVESDGRRSNALRLPMRIVPRGASLEPDVALPGQEVVLRGQNLESKNVLVTVGGQNASVKEVKPTFVRFEVPRFDNMVEGQGVVVAVQSGGETARPLTLTLGRLPLLTGMEPSRGESGEKVVLRGRGFDADATANRVTFGGEPALVLSASDHQLEVVVPAISTPGNYFKTPVAVQAKGASTAGPFEFGVLRPSSGVFVPRFFPAPVPEDPRRAFVSSEAGPLMLLSSADASQTVAERAQQVATALNTLFRSGTGTVEVRSGDLPAVAVAGSGTPLVRVTAEDAAGYSQSWNTAMKGQRTSATALAAYWSSLLQDYLTLFVQRQRPTRVVELSTRGKVLLELHAEGERRMGPGGGVPSGLLAPPNPAMAAAMRDLALGLPSRGQAVAGAALVGRWSGSMEEEGAGSKPFDIILRLDGTKLAGAISTRSGKLSMDVPLKSVSYERGQVTFEVAGGKRFRGTQSGSTLSGDIVDRSQKAMGRFTLQYVQ